MEFCSVEACLRGKRGREGCAEVTAIEGNILRKGADRAACEDDMREFGSEGVIPILFADDCLERVGLSGHLTFGDIEVNARPKAKLLDYVEERYRILH
jgi:hypothetical protein